jgi:dUTP pyrophosphatase
MDLDFTKLTENFDPEMRAEILQQLEKIKKQSGVSFENDYKKDLENIEDVLGMSFSEMETEMNNLLRERKINVELIDESAVFPKYAYPSDSGFDLHSTQDLEIGPFGRILVPTGLKVSFDEGYEIQVRPKSGLAIKQGLTVLNTPGTVDQGYTGEIQVIVFNTNNYSVTIPKGMKVGQAVLCPVVQGKYVKFERVNEIENKDRGANGFGSTGI